MKGGKLFELLKALSRQEFKDLKKVVSSPIYNTNDRMGVLYEALKTDYPNFNPDQPYKEKLFALAFPDEPFNNYKIHRLFTQMTQLVEEYLLLLEMRANQTERKKRLIHVYEKRHLKAFFDQETRELSQILAARTDKDLEYYQEQIFLNDSLYFHPLHDKYALDDTALDQLMNSLDAYFILAKMRYGISLKNRERILAKPGIWRFMNVLESEANFIKNDVLFQLYQLAFLLLEEAQSVDFETYEKLLLEHIDHFKNDSGVLFFSGLNYINRQLNQGVSGFGRKAFEWYRLGLEKALLFDNEQLSDVTFGNIVICGCREKEFEWTENFMAQYGQYLDDSHRQEILNYHSGVWHFYQKRFTQTYGILMNSSFPDAYFLKSRLLTIRAIFENFLQDDQYYDLLMHQIKAFKQSIKRNKVFSRAAMEPTLNTVHIIQLFAKKKYDFESTKSIRNTLSKKIANTNKLAGKDWLLEKLKEL